MTYPHAINIAAGIIAAAIIFTQNTSADILGGSGRFVPAGTIERQLGAWRLDTETGQMMFCWYSPYAKAPQNAANCYSGIMAE